MGAFLKLGVPFWGPPQRNCSILAVYVGVPLFRETTIFRSGIRGMGFGASIVGFLI